MKKISLPGRTDHFYAINPESGVYRAADETERAKFDQFVREASPRRLAQKGGADDGAGEGEPMPEVLELEDGQLVFNARTHEYDPEGKSVKPVVSSAARSLLLLYCNVDYLAGELEKALSRIAALEGVGEPVREPGAGADGEAAG